MSKVFVKEFIKQVATTTAATEFAGAFAGSFASEAGSFVVKKLLKIEEPTDLTGALWIELKGIEDDKS